MAKIYKFKAQVLEDPFMEIVVNEKGALFKPNSKIMAAFGLSDDPSFYPYRS